MSYSHYHALHDKRAHRANQRLAKASSQEEEWALIHQQAQALRAYRAGGLLRR